MKLIYIPPYFIEVPKGKSWRKSLVHHIESLPHMLKKGEELHILPRSAETELMYQEAEKTMGGR